MIILGRSLRRSDFMRVFLVLLPIIIQSIAPTWGQAPDPAINRCDEIAASPFDNDRRSGVIGIDAMQIDSAKAVEICRAALLASPTDPQTIYQLARALVAGKSDQNVIEAASLTKQAAEMGYAAAQTNLGFFFEQGQGGFEKNVEEAQRLYETAASRGNAVALYNLAMLLQKKSDAVSEREAASLLRKATDQGFAAAQNALATFYFQGRGGIAKDADAGMSLLKAAAERGDADALNNLAGQFAAGTNGLKKDDVEALRLYRLAAAKNHVQALNAIGQFYEFGRANLKDDKEAARFYLQAAALNYPPAQRNLGLFYLYGYGGLPKDETEGMRLLQMAADQKFLPAIINLATAYEKRAVDAVSKQAIELYKVAAELGSTEAKQKLERIKHANSTLNTKTVSQRSSTANIEYDAAISNHIKRFIRFPNLADHTTTRLSTSVEFSLDYDGNLTRSRVVFSSGNDAADNEALAILQRAAPFPTPPKDYQLPPSYTLPLHFERQPVSVELSEQVKSIASAAASRFSCVDSNGVRQCTSDGFDFLWCKTDADLNAIESVAIRNRSTAKLRFDDLKNGGKCGSDKTIILDASDKILRTGGGVLLPRVSKQVYFPNAAETRFLSSPKCESEAYCSVKIGDPVYACRDHNLLTLPVSELKGKLECEQLLPGDTFSIEKATPSSVVRIIPRLGALNSLYIAKSSLLASPEKIEFRERRGWCQIDTWCATKRPGFFCTDEKEINSIGQKPFVGQRGPESAEKTCRIVGANALVSPLYAGEGSNIISVKHPVFGKGFVLNDLIDEVASETPIKITSTLNEIKVYLGKSPIMRAQKLSGQGSTVASATFRSSDRDIVEFCSAYFPDGPEQFRCKAQEQPQAVLATANCSLKQLRVFQRNLRLLDRPPALGPDANLDIKRRLLWQDADSKEWLDGSSASGEATFDSILNALCPSVHDDAEIGILFRDPSANYPLELRGAWTLRRATCTEFRKDPDNFIAEDFMRVSRTERDAYEYHETINVVRKLSENSWSIDYSWTAEGDRGNGSALFKHDRGTLTISSVGGTQRWTQCARPFTAPD